MLPILTLFLVTVDAYQPSFVPRVRPVSRLDVRATSHHRRTSLHAVAAEFEELQRHEDNNKNNNDDDEQDWIATPSGGFLPNLFRRHKKPTTTPDHHQSSDACEIIQEVSTLPDYKRVVADETEQMVVVLFHAHWCRACKATLPLFRKLARDYPEIMFVRVPLTQDNGFLHDGLGVPSLPFGHLYHPSAGLVEERKLNKHVFGEFRHVLKDYVRGYCDIEDKDGVSGSDGRIGETADTLEKDEEPSLS
jgi:thiol-disulfide isomerase/thioredoxin